MENLIFSIFVFLLYMPIVRLIRYFAQREENQKHSVKIKFFNVQTITGWFIFTAIILLILIFQSAVFIYDNYPCEFFSNQDAYNFLTSTMNKAYLLLPLIYAVLTVRTLYMYFRKFSFSAADTINKAFFSLGAASYLLLLMFASNGIRNAMQSGGGCNGL